MVLNRFIRYKTRRSWVPFTHTSQDKSRQTSCSLDATILFLGYAIAVRPITTVVIGPADATPAYQWPPYHSIISIQHINPISIVLNLCQNSMLVETLFCVDAILSKVIKSSKISRLQGLDVKKKWFIKY